MATPIEIDDAIVLLLGAGVDEGSRARIEGVTRLEKLIFLLERETHSDQWLSEDAGFVAYNFGPFSRKVYDAVDTLAAAGIITDSARFAPDDMDTWEKREAITDEPDDGYSYTTRDFELTDRGWRYFAALDAEMKPEALRELTSFKARFAPLPLRQLVRYVYQRYDEFTTNSLIRDDILGRNSPDFTFLGSIATWVLTSPGLSGNGPQVLSSAFVPSAKGDHQLHSTTTS